MAKKKMGGLGKGLDSLFADLSDDTGSEASNSTLPLREIEPDPEQPRKRFDDDALNQLADSITEGICREKAGQEPQRRDQQPAPAGPARGCAPYGQRGQAELWPRQGPAGAAQ